MAKPPIPTDPAKSGAAEERRRKREQQREAEDDALLKEIDDAVRQDDLSEFGKRYGVPIGAALVLGLAAFGGYLWWDDRQEAAMEARSEALITALDQAEAGNFAAASARLEPIAQDGSAGAKAVAAMLEGGIALENGNPRRAGEIFAGIADNPDVPDAMRSLARVRQVAVQFDQLEPSDIVAMLKDEATPGSPYFGSAAEMTAMALLEQGRNEEAAALFAEIAASEDVPESLKSRTRQMAGLLGVDTVEDVDEAVAETSEDVTGPVAE